MKLGMVVGEMIVMLPVARSLLRGSLQVQEISFHNPAAIFANFSTLYMYYNNCSPLEAKAGGAHGQHSCQMHVAR